MEPGLAAFQHDAGGLGAVEVGLIAAQLGALQAGRGRGSGEGEEETQEVGARRGVRQEKAVGRRRRGDGGRRRREIIGGGGPQRAFVVVAAAAAAAEGGDEVGAGTCRGGGTGDLACGCRGQLAAGCVRRALRAGGPRGLGLQLQFSLGAGAVYKVQPATQAVHALAHVIE